MSELSFTRSHVALHDDLASQPPRAVLWMSPSRALCWHILARMSCIGHNLEPASRRLERPVAGWSRPPGRMFTPSPPWHIILTTSASRRAWGRWTDGAEPPQVEPSPTAGLSTTLPVSSGALLCHIAILSSVTLAGWILPMHQRTGSAARKDSIVLHMSSLDFESHRLICAPAKFAEVLVTWAPELPRAPACCPHVSTARFVQRRSEATAAAIAPQRFTIHPLAQMTTPWAIPVVLMTKAAMIATILMPRCRPCSATARPWARVVTSALESSCGARRSGRRRTSRRGSGSGVRTQSTAARAAACCGCWGSGYTQQRRCAASCGIKASRQAPSTLRSATRRCGRRAPRMHAHHIQWWRVGCGGAASVCLRRPRNAPALLATLMQTVLI